ncbi:MAG: hypothetical protein AAB921_02245, partial [Patescibacteria group bacterium]
MKPITTILPLALAAVLIGSPLAVLANENDDSSTDVEVSASVEAEVEVRGNDDRRDEGRRIDLIERAKKERMDMQERFRASFGSSTKPRPASTSMPIKERIQDRDRDGSGLDGSKMQARGEVRIEDRIKRLEAQIERISKMERLSSEQKATITAELKAQVASLTELKTKIDAETDPAKIKELTQTIGKEYRTYAVAMPKAALTAAADRIMKVVGQMEAFTAKLEARVSASGSAEATTLLGEYTTSVASAKTNAQAAASLVADLKADEGDATVASSNTAALKSAKEKIDAAQAILKEARQDIGSILKLVKG